MVTCFTFFISGFCRYIGFGLMLQWHFPFYQIYEACNKLILTILQIFIYNIKIVKLEFFIIFLTYVCFLLFLIHVWDETDTPGRLHWSWCIYFCLLLFPSRYTVWHIKCSTVTMILTFITKQIRNMSFWVYFRTASLLKYCYSRNSAFIKFKSWLSFVSQTTQSYSITYIINNLSKIIITFYHLHSTFFADRLYYIFWHLYVRTCDLAR